MNVTIFIVIYGKEMVSLESQSISDFYFKKEIFQFLVSLEEFEQKSYLVQLSISISSRFIKHSTKKGK